VQIEAEERERLGERAAAQRHLGPAVRERVECGEALVDANRIVRAEHGDRRPQPDPRRSGGDRGEHHLRRGDREVVPVVLADAEAVHPGALGQLSLLDDVADHPRVRQSVALGIDAHVAEGVQPELDLAHGPI
jgi:hypothetical protein